MTTRYQYKNRWEQLESEIAELQKQSDEEYKKLPAVSHECKAWQKAFDGYYSTILRPNKEKIEKMKREAEYCRIRSLDKFYCNRHLYSDIQPYEVVEIISDDRLKLRSMDFVQTNGSVERLKESFSPGGFLGHFDNSVQEWICKPDENGIVVEVRRRKDGFFYEVGGSIPFVLSDQPRRFRDFNF